MIIHMEKKKGKLFIALHDIRLDQTDVVVGLVSHLLNGQKYLMILLRFIFTHKINPPKAYSHIKIVRCFELLDFT